jgi:hypothetical protein
VISAPVLAVPLVALAPVQSPLAVQDVGLLVADQVSVELLPDEIAIGLALNETIGAAGIVTFTVAVRVVLCPESFVHTRL